MLIDLVPEFLSALEAAELSAQGMIGLVASARRTFLAYQQIVLGR